MIKTPADLRPYQSAHLAFLDLVEGPHRVSDLVDRYNQIWKSNPWSRPLDVVVEMHREIRQGCQVTIRRGNEDPTVRVME